jgi:hypothetical protein
MEYLKKRLRFILILIFSIAILAFVQYEFATDPKLTANRIQLTGQLLKIACGGFALYAVVQFFRVK